MSAEDDMREISPEEIKRIRKSLGLSQAEAGRLLGGGPSAFAKYEKGSVRPSASLLKMLNFLRSRPEELEALTTGRANDAGKAGTTPFEVTSEHVSALKARDFSVLVGKLLSAEAQESDIPLDGIHVSYEISAADGGEDARIEWRDGRPRTDFLPGRLCQFQLKTGEISPAEAGEEVLDSKKQLKPMIREVLEKGGFYIMLCSHDYSKKTIQNRESSILENIRKHLPKIEETRVRFRDSGQIAAWVAGQPPAALWLLKNIHSPRANPSFGDWDHWSRRAEHSGAPWVKDPRLPDFREKLLSIVQIPKGVVRVAGPSGAGKSRLALEAFRPTREEKVRLSDLVLYAVESEAGTLKIKELAWDLVNSKRRAVLTVDRCSEETRVDLAGIVRHSDSKVSLVTINSETPLDAEESEDTLVINRAEHPLIEKIVESIDPSISPLDRRRIVGFSDGIVLCARIISKSWNRYGLTASDDDEMLLKKFMGHDDGESGRVYKAAKLISAFGVLQTISPSDEEKEYELEEAAKTVGISIQDILDAMEKLERRGMVQRHENLAMLRPEHIAVKLAERQWVQWNNSFNSLSEKLIRKTAPRLALLNMRPVAAEAARKICGNGKLWFPPEKWRSNSGILISLAQIDARRVGDLLEKIIGPLTRAELNNLGREQDNTVRTLSIITSLDSTAFEKAALLLFRFAVEETRPRRHATDQFKSLFPAKYSRTAAGPEKRLEVIDKLKKEAESIDEHRADAHLSVITDSLLEGAKTTGFSVEPGPRIHGSRPALEPWWPETRQEYLDYVRECSKRLVELAKRNDDTGARARTGLARNWHPYVLDGLIEDVERWTQEVMETHPYWPEALNSLEQLLRYGSNKLSPSTKERVDALVSRLTPEGLEYRVRFLVTEMPGGYLGREGMDIGTMDELQSEELKKLAGELLDGGEDKLAKFIPDLSRGRQNRALQFGSFLAEKTEKPLYWKKLMMEEFKSAPADERSHELLVGYLAGLKDKDPKEFEKFKREAAESPVFAPVLLALTACTGISSEDVSAAIKALETGLIEPAAMNFWCRTALTELRPSDVAPLFGFMLEKKEPRLFEVALKLMGMYMHDKEERLDELAPQLLLAAEYPSIVRDWNNESPYHYEVLMNRLMSRGSEDPYARTAAILISRQLVDETLHLDGVRIISRILPALLSNLGEIVWPSISKAVEERPDEWKLSDALTSSPPRGGEDPAILSLPENLLFGWCHANPGFAPAFVAGAVPVLKETGEGTELHPTVRRLLNEFGERGDVLDGLESNIPGPVWHGSLEDGLVPYKEPLMKIRNHEKKLVRRWAAGMLEKIDSQIEDTRRREKENGFGQR